MHKSKAEVTELLDLSCIIKHKHKKKQTQWCLLLWMTAIINRWAAHTGQWNTTCCAKGGHGIKMPDWTMGGSKKKKNQCRHMKTNQATRAVSKVECETGRSGLGSYLLLFVGLGPPTKWTSPTSIDRDQVLPNALFTVQFNHILEGRSPLAPQQSQQRYFRDRFAIIWTMTTIFCHFASVHHKNWFEVKTMMWLKCRPWL